MIKVVSISHKSGYIIWNRRQIWGQKSPNSFIHSHYLC